MLSVRNYKEDDKSLINNDSILELLSEFNYFKNNRIIDNIISNSYPLDTIPSQDMCFYKIKQLSYDEESPKREAFENVLLNMSNSAFNFVYILTGDEKGVELYIGVVKNGSCKNRDNNISASNYGKSIADAFSANFSGSVLEKISEPLLSDMASYSVGVYKNAGVIMGVPSVNENKSEHDFQGIDRLINSMIGSKWRIVIVCEPVSNDEIIDYRESIYALYNRLSVYAKRNLQYGLNDGLSMSFSQSNSNSKSKSKSSSDSLSKSSGSSENNSHSSTNSGKSNTKSTSTSCSDSKSQSESSTLGSTRGSTQSIGIEMVNKKVQEILKYIDEELIERIKLGYSKGLYKTSVYYMAGNPVQADRLKSGILSLFQGEKSTYSPLIAKKIDLNKYGHKVLRSYQNIYTNIKDYQYDILTLLSRPYNKDNIALSTYLNVKEICILAGLPQKEVPGIPMREAVSFGLNIKNVKGDDSIMLGSIVHNGRNLKNLKFSIDRNALNKHTFIAGTTGSGKTTTCHKLLKEAKDVPFLVIEPAKTEYRTLVNSDEFKDVLVFTVGNENVAPFRINPLEIIKGESISSHIDILKATFTSAFPMEGSMPQLLEEAMYQCYKDKGWDVNTNENRYYGETAFDAEVNSFPILTDLLNAIGTIVKEKGFGQRLESEYLGSLVSRLSNLTVGSKGSMLNCSRSMDFKYIAHHNVILELEDLKNPEDKALVMGIVISRLSEIIKQEHKLNKNYRHLTLIEEAHRLLSKVDYNDLGSKKVAVETFSDLLAEIRKYGEGLIIVDQIPNKLASEVLKNTNTKIIHRILAKDDKEAVGDAMLMDDKQKKYLSALRVGEVIVFTDNTDKPVNVMIEAVTDTSEEEIDNSVVASRFKKFSSDFGYMIQKDKIILEYEKFKILCDNLKKNNIEQLYIDNIILTVEGISEKLEVDKKFVWETWIDRWIHLNNKEFHKYHNELMELFTVNLYNSDFSKKDIVKLYKNNVFL